MTYHGTIVTLNPAMAQMLTLVIVLASISIMPVKVNPKRE